MVAWRRRGAFCKGVVSTAAAGAGLVVAFGVAMAGSGTAAISQTVIYPVLWAMSSTWMRGVIRTVILGSALVVGSGLGRGDWIEGSITALISVVFSIAVGTWIQRIDAGECRFEQIGGAEAAGEQRRAQGRGRGRQVDVVSHAGHSVSTARA